MKKAVGWIGLPLKNLVKMLVFSALIPERILAGVICFPRVPQKATALVASRMEGVAKRAIALIVLLLKKWV